MSLWTLTSSVRSKCSPKPTEIAVAGRNLADPELQVALSCVARAEVIELQELHLHWAVQAEKSEWVLFLDIGHFLEFLEQFAGSLQRQFQARLWRLSEGVASRRSIRVVP